MKTKLTTILTILICTISKAQDCDNFTSGAISYVFPKGVSVEGGKTFQIGFTGAVGFSIQAPKTYQTKTQSGTPIDSVGNFVDIYSYIGWRLLKVDYVISIYANAGAIMGDAAGLKPMASIKFLFPTGNNAISVEPFYIMDRGFSGRLSYHFKL